MRERILIIAAFIALDYITGICKAVSTGTYKSGVMRAGLWHKIAECIALVFAFLCDYSLPLVEVSLPFSVFNAVLVYLVIMECSSIIENIGMIFPELGDKLGAIFEVLKNEK